MSAVDAPLTRRRLRRPDLVGWALLSIVVVGAIVRFGGIGWGLPLQLHADEWVVVEGAIDMAQRNSFAPPFFFRPDHLETQLSYIIYQAWSYLFGGGSPEALFAVDQAPFYALARATTATLGTASIVVAYFIGSSYARTAGLWSAFAIAFFPPLVEHSRYATPDVPLVFAVLLTILGAVRYIQRESWPWLVLASAGVAIGITAKYPAVAATSTIAVAVIVASIRSRQYWRIPVRGAAAIVMVLGFTFALSPTLFINFSEVRAQLFQQNSTGHLGADGLDWSGNALFYASSFLSSGGIIVVLFAAAGLIAAVVGRRWDMTPLLTGVVFWVAISVLTLHWDRWGLPMFITPLLLAAVGLDAAWRWSSLRGRTPRVVVGVLAAVSGLSLLLASFAQLAVALAPDTRETAAAGLAARGIEADDTFYDGYTPFNTDGPRNLAAELAIVDGVVGPREGIDPLPYILTSSSMVDRYLLAENKPEEQAVYAAIQQLPIDTEWDSVGIVPASPWEPVRIWKSIDFLAQIAGGANGGPQLILHRTPGTPSE
ncbi:glycosyltransferase family 39 protein [Microbacterium sp. kSW2-24]|uniref:ArnT family glycosyltransferase n=1 Tax=Microbacterium galbinum TaxID=2851646 RepID=UPI001FFDDF1D|nr:phospholipid carrier-dependent glycosyltransferase [Microbacterium galbinum]MCK2022195.1 glycosyltransferase family 39 protein [Microbacterium galbinum]